MTTIDGDTFDVVVEFQFPVGKSHLDDELEGWLRRKYRIVSVPRREEPPR